MRREPGNQEQEAISFAAEEPGMTAYFCFRLFISPKKEYK
jgi:hypothetical protein